MGVLSLLVPVSLAYCNLGMYEQYHCYPSLLMFVLPHDENFSPTPSLVPWDLMCSPFALQQDAHDKHS